MNAMRSGISLVNAARDFNVPRNTIREHLKGNVPPPGEKTILTTTQENVLKFFCLPPHTSHRLQPLDTHVNNILKQYWREELSKFLRDNDRIALPRDKFCSVLRGPWMRLVSERTRVIDAFNYCGLYPLRNVISDNEYKKASIFTDKTTSQQSTSGDSHDIRALRNLSSTPKKVPKVTHQKMHEAHATSPSFIEKVSLKTGSKISSVAQIKPTCKKRVLNLASSTIPFMKRKKTDAAPPVARTTRTNEPPPNQAGSSNQDGVVRCRVCHGAWSDTVEDWFECCQCKAWACACFAIDVCFFSAN